MKSKKKIIIADDHTIIREAIKLVFHTVPHLRVVADTGDGSQVVKLCREYQPDLLLLDISLPNRDGLDILKQLKDEFESLRVLIFSVHDESKYAVRALKAGAYGYLNKKSASDVLLKAVESILDGRKYITPEMAEALANWVVTDQDRPAHQKLSNRELQTLQLISSGLSVGDIAIKLNLSVKTISMYRARVLDKLGLRNNADLIRYSLDNELIDPL